MSCISCGFSRCCASMIFRHLLLQLLFCQHGCNTLAASANVVPAWLPYIYCFSKCSVSTVAIHLLFQQVYCQHGYHTRALSVGVLSAWLPYTWCFKRCSASMLATHLLFNKCSAAMLAIYCWLLGIVQASAWVSGWRHDTFTMPGLAGPVENPQTIVPDQIWFHTRDP